ncbi:MAG: ABC transporter permease [Deltaproteobacteria bacterium]|nr:ABC transporter permease [Deltaproteobacteria bacterium]
MTAFVSFILTALRLSTPLSYAALGGYCSERSGTINIALEGMMLMGSFTAAVVAQKTHCAAYGVLAGIGGGMALAALHGFLCITLRSDQIISGMAVNFLAMGLPPVISKALYDMSGGTPMLQTSERVASWFGVSPLVAGAFVAAALLIFIHRSSRLGQYLRFAGEHPDALQSQGVSVRRVRWLGVLLAGVLCGLAGSYLSIDHGGGFARNMTAGRGYIALAALIIGCWTPHGALIAALAFGLIDASQILLQGTTLPFGLFGGQTVPVQWIQMLPYIATLAILAGAAGGKTSRRFRARPPKALGTPF